MPNEPDVTNWRHQGNARGVGSSIDGKEIRIIGLLSVIKAGDPLRQKLLWPLTLPRQAALELAAWIVAVAIPEKKGLTEFERILDYIRDKPVA